MKARLTQHQQTPRKMRLVADSVRGMRLDQAMQTLEFMPKKAAKTLHKLLSSALANSGDDESRGYFVKTLMVDEGPRYRRSRPGFRGSSDPYYKRTSHVTVELGKYNNVPKQAN